MIGFLTIITNIPDRITNNEIIFNISTEYPFVKDSFIINRLIIFNMIVVT
jgi:hypothetical protein